MPWIRRSDLFVIPALSVKLVMLVSWAAVCWSIFQGDARAGYPVDSIAWQSLLLSLSMNLVVIGALLNRRKRYLWIVLPAVLFEFDVAVTQLRLLLEISALRLEEFSGWLEWLLDMSYFVLLSISPWVVLPTLIVRFWRTWRRRDLRAA